MAPGAPDRDGLPERGLRRIEPDEAAIVRRVFAQYASGRSARAIAHQLNAESIRGPSGGTWGHSTLAGNAMRGTGMLNNELYIGRLVWNRLRYIKDPTTGKRVSRLNVDNQQVIVAVPELRIVDDALWQAVKVRQGSMTTKSSGEERPDQAKPFWDRRRPRYLFSGLMCCGVCGGGFSKISTAHFGCSTARNKGTCDNRLTIRRDVLETTVLDALRHRLMDPELFAVFVTEFTAEYNRLQASAGAGLATKRGELAEIRRRIDGLLRVFEDGLYEASMKERMQGLERRRAVLEVELTAAAEPKPRLHPGLADVYRAKMAGLHEALAAEDGAETSEAIRALVEAIVLVPEEGTLRIDVRGDLAAILALGQTQTTHREGRVDAGLLEQVKLVAGAGFEPATFRL